MLLGLFSACIEVVDLDVEKIPHELVVNCLFTEAQPFMVNVSRLAPYPDLDDRNIENATVSIYKNGELEGILNHTENGIYNNASFSPSSGNTYSIKVEVPDYPTVTASDTLPDKVFIDSCRYKPEAGKDYEGDYYDEIAVSFTDNREKTFYSINVQHQSTNSDTNEKYWYSITLSTNDPVILAEGISTNDYKNYFVFNDALLSNQHFKVVVKYYSDYETGDKFKVFLKTGTEHYYKYRKTLLKHAKYSYEDPFKPYSPVPLYSNINGGQGIFAGFQSDIYNITYP